MTTQLTITPDQLDELRDAVSDVDGTLRPYSGRAMYGQECLGIDLDSEADAFRIALAIQSSDLADALSRPRYDSMGLGIIVYFPNVAVPEGVTDDDDEYEDE
jgi:hypothetical protein